jgi:hypothetical protein
LGAALFIDVQPEWSKIAPWSGHKEQM